MEHSSTINASASNGFSSLRLYPSFGLYSNSRWMVLASMPVASLIRLAALPVGAASKILMPAVFKAAMMPWVVVVLPVPGPPVRIITLDSTA